MRRGIGVLLFAVACASHVPTWAGDRPVVVSPGSSTTMPMIEGSCPTFSWGSIPGAERYDLLVYRIEARSGSLAGASEDNTLVLQRSFPGSVSSWTPSLDQCLSSGGRYGWTIRAVDQRGGTGWSLPSLFQVSDVPSAAEVDAALALLARYRRHQQASEPSEAVATSVMSRTPVQVPSPRESKRAKSRSTGELEDTTLTPDGLLGLAGLPGGQVSGQISATPAPSATPSLTVDDQIHLGAASDIFKDGSVILWEDTVGNTGIGPESLSSNTSGFNNTGVGDRALRDTTEGTRNTAIGHKPLMFNTTGSYNTASGYQTLLHNTVGYHNTATGTVALRSNTEGARNTAMGSLALRNSTEGDRNTASGFGALYANTLGNLNTASGNYALFNNTEGYANTAIGNQALRLNTTGDRNVAVGEFAGGDATTGDDNVFIANRGVAGDTAKIKIGTAGTHTETYVAGIRAVTPAVADTLPVLIDSAGQLGTGLSGSADLTFGVGLTCDIQTITVTGAVAGSPVLLGLPPGDHSHILATAWVSATDTVIVRVCRANGGSLQNHADGIYKVAVIPV